MKSLRILSSIAICLTVLAAPLLGSSNQAHANTFYRQSFLDENLIRTRFEQMESAIAPVWHPSVKSYIESYVIRARIDTEQLVGRTMHYFPIFEHYLKLYGLPEELKYLPAWESRLDAQAMSPVGAAGLWQLMPATARKFGLVVNNTLDERFDPYKSTEAGVKYLAELYDTFGDWTIAMAAYNCGPGRMNKALKTSGQNDYWKLRRYIPGQTRDYIPAILATTYVMHYYSFHDVRPRYPDYNFQMVRATKVYEAISLRKIAKMTGVSLSDIRLLNPSYLKSAIPRSRSGNYLVLPERAASIFRNVYQKKRPKRQRTNVSRRQNSDLQTGYKVLCVVKPGDTIAYIASLYKCTSEEIMTWNDLDNRELYVRQELIIHIPVKNKSQQQKEDRS